MFVKNKFWNLVSKVFWFQKGDGFIWFRLFGKGLIVKRVLSKAEKYGHMKYFKIGKWIVRFL